MLIQHLNQQRLERERQGLRRQRRIAESPCAPRQEVALEGAETSRSTLAFCSNDYLGLAQHPALTEALIEGARRWGTGSGASHLVSGHTRAHAALEQELAQSMAPFIPQARALSFSTGYMANLALLTALGDAQATIFADKLNHASLVDGALLSQVFAKATLQRYPHGQLDTLERQLERCTTPIKLIVTDSVFSMDGDIADLPALLALAQRFDAWLILDDAHGFGVLGAQGQGALAHFNLHSERLIYMGTLGKAAGVAGAFVAAHADVIDALIQSARSYIYTTATPAALAHALRTSLALIRGDEGMRRRAHLQKLICLFRERVTPLLEPHAQRGLRLAPSETPIQPLIVGRSEDAVALSAALEAQGIWVSAIRPPTVPQGTARLRISLSAAHSEDDVLQLVQALARVLT